VEGHIRLFGYVKVSEAIGEICLVHDLSGRPRQREEDNIKWMLKT
jgi:hypothetical protein